MIKSFCTLFLIGYTITLHAAFIVEDAETGTMKNSLGGDWASYNDGYSVISITPDASPAYAGNYCKRLNWTINAGSGSPYAGAATALNSGWTGVDLSAYYGVRFFARGNGTYAVSLGTDQTRVESNHYSKEITITSEWRLYELPFLLFAQTWGNTKP
jgi:hypothetical protein